MPLAAVCWLLLLLLITGRDASWIITLLHSHLLHITALGDVRAAGLSSFFMACVVPYSGKATYGTNNINEPTCPKRK